MQVTIIGAGLQGGGTATRQLEQLGLLHIGLQDRLGTGFRSAVKFIW